VLINDTETWYYLDASGGVIEGGRTAPGGAASLLVAAGGTLDEELARKHGLADKLVSAAKYEHRDPVTGEPLVMVGGRAFARRLVDPPKPAAVPGHLAPEAKHVAGPPETKAEPAAVPGVPVAATPAPVATLPAGSPAPAAAPAAQAPKGNGGK
jgi:hypothetical protein